MTREEAIKRLEWLRMVGNHVDSVTLGKDDMPHFDMAISALREQPRWISVEERLPEKYTIVLCYKDGQRRLGYYIGAEYGKGVAAFRHPKDQWAFGVTHWMPLPEPPEVEV